MRAMSETSKKLRVVVVGGGFAGIKTALELIKDRSLVVTLISDKDHFVYYPTLYSMATGHSHLETIVPLNRIFAGKRITIVQDTITGYDPDRNTVTGRETYNYDRVIFAVGVVTSYFGIKGLPEFSYSIKSYNDVMKFRHHLHDELVKDHHLDKHYVVVGAGPTGVELSAALASYLRIISRVHKTRNTKVSIKLVEAAPRVLPRMSENASDRVQRHLRKLGVTVLLNKKVEEQDDDSIMISGKDVPTKTVVWTSGVSNHPFFASHSSHFPLAPNGRVTVNEHMMVNDNTYVIGDNAATPHTGLAQTALHDALYVAKDIKNELHYRSRTPYKAVKPPVVIPVGNRWAVFEWHGLTITGWLAAMIRRAADFIGYSDILPIGQAFGVWRAERIREETTCQECTQALI